MEHLPVYAIKMGPEKYTKSKNIYYTKSKPSSVIYTLT